MHSQRRTFTEIFYVTLAMNFLAKFLYLTDTPNLNKYKCIETKSAKMHKKKKKVQLLDPTQMLKFF